MEDLRSDGMRAEFYRVAGIVRTPNTTAAVLVDVSAKRYIPVFIPESYAEMIESLLANNTPSPVDLGLFFSFWSLLKACACHSARVIIERKDDDEGAYFSSWVDSFHKSEAGISMARVPVSVCDSCVLSILGEMPFVVYDRPEDPASVEIPGDPGKDMQAILAAVVSDIMETEDEIEVEAVGLNDDSEDDNLEGDMFE